MAYIPNPVDVTQPVESVLAQTAAAEFRSLKAYIQTIVSGGGLGVATPGQIALFPGITPLPGWLECNGALVSRATYPELWAAAQALGNVVTEANWLISEWGNFSSGDGTTTFRLPEYRGEFIRAWDNGRGIDPTRGPGSRQTATLIGIYAHTDGGTPGAGGAVNLAFSSPDGNSPINTIPNASYAINALAGTLVGPNAGYQTAQATRPRNQSAMYCIKT